MTIRYLSVSSLIADIFVNSGHPRLWSFDGYYPPPLSPHYLHYPSYSSSHDCWDRQPSCWVCALFALAPRYGGGYELENCQDHQCCRGKEECVNRWEGKLKAQCKMDIHGLYWYNVNVVYYLDNYPKLFICLPVRCIPRKQSCSPKERLLPDRPFPFQSSSSLTSSLSSLSSLSPNEI